jgi:Transposase DDE domain.
MANEARSKADFRWQLLRKNEKEVAKRVLGGRYELIGGTGWGFLDEFFIFLEQLGFFNLLEVKGEYERRMVPMALMLATYNAKVLQGLASMNQVPECLFKDIALLRLLGFTAKQVKEGFSKRGRGGPLHKDTIANALERLSQKESNGIFDAAVGLLSKAGFLRGERLWVLDSTDLVTTERYEGCGRRTKEAKGVSKTEYGFKLMMLWDYETRIPVAQKTVTIERSEKREVPGMMAKAQENLGRRPRGVVLLDRGFTSGEDLWVLKHRRGLDFVIPSRDDMHITRDARELRVFSETVEEDDLEVYAVTGLSSWDQYVEPGLRRQNPGKEYQPDALNAVVVVRWRKTVYEPGKEKVFLTTLPVDDPLSIIKKYKIRSLIENAGFRELKQGWCLESFPSKRRRAVQAHIVFTLLMYGLTNAYRTNRGQKLKGRGIRRYRRQKWQDPNKIIIVSDEYYGIFDIEEFVVLLARPPTVFMRVDPKETKKRLGLK